MALPVLMQGNHRILFARLGLVGGKGHEHRRPPCRCQECTLVPPDYDGLSQKRRPSLGEVYSPEVPITSGESPIFWGDVSQWERLTGYRRFLPYVGDLPDGEQLRPDRGEWRRWSLLSDSHCPSYERYESGD